MRDIFRKCKSFIQRGKRGWADCDVWGMDSYLIDIIIPMLTHLKKTQNGYPGGDDCPTPEKWDEILDSMILGFEAGKRVIEDDYLDDIQPGWYENRPLGMSPLESGITQKSIKELVKRTMADQELFHERMKLFDKWFFALWD